MFKRTRWKIVAAIMSILILLWVGTLGVIYASSYMEMKAQNARMLKTHAEMHTLAPTFGQPLRPNDKPRPEGDRGVGSDSPLFRLSTFYSVALAEDGSVLEIRNESPTVYTDAELEALAKRLVGDDDTEGTADNLAFYKTDKGTYTLVVFMDNTVVNERAMTLLRYTLIFGGVALVAFFFLSVFLARKIVTPLEESYQKQKQFNSDAGHELKTPISVVSANAELLAREMGDNRWLANIQYENERMGVLVGQLLDLARTENVTLPTERLDLSRLTDGEALPFESVAYERGLTLRCDVAEAIAVVGNGTQLRQLVSILLDNAVRHSAGEGEVGLSLKREHGAAVLSVKNAGEPIPEAVRERLFERFYRVDAARNSEGGHYGLGLAIAKAIVTAHKGRIDVLCYDGVVEFRVQIPAV